MAKEASLLAANCGRSPDLEIFETSTLLDAARDLASTLELRLLLELLLDRLRALVGYVGTAILILQDEELVFAGIRNPDSFTWDEARKIRYPVAALRNVWPRLCAGEAVIIPDVRGTAPKPRSFVGRLATTACRLRSRSSAL